MLAGPPHLMHAVQLTRGGLPGWALALELLPCTCRQTAWAQMPGAAAAVHHGHGGPMGSTTGAPRMQLHLLQRSRWAGCGICTCPYNACAFGMLRQLVVCQFV